MRTKQTKCVLDLLLFLAAGTVALMGYFYYEGSAKWAFLAAGGAGALAFLLLAVHDRRAPERQYYNAGAPISDTPPAAQITELVLLSEEDQPLASWTLYGKTSMAVGRDVGENQVDINLSSSAYASTVDVEHAVLNYSGGIWYVEDLASKNGVSVQTRADGRKYRLAPDQPCRLHPGDIIFVGLARLLIR